MPKLSFCLHLHGISFLIPSLSVPKLLALKWVSYRQHIDGSYCFHSFNCPISFDWAFSPSPFKMIIDRYVLIAILLLVFWLFYSSLWLSSSFSLFPGILVTFFSIMFRFFSFFFLSIYCRILVFGCHELDFIYMCVCVYRYI